MTGARQFVLPDLLTIIPYPWSCNPHHPEASVDAAAWLDSFDLLNAKAKRGLLELSAAYMYPDVGLEELRTCCDCINAITVLDEITDIQDGEAAQQSTDTYLAAISGKPGEATNLYRMISQ